MNPAFKSNGVPLFNANGTPALCKPGGCCGDDGDIGSCLDFGALLDALGDSVSVGVKFESRGSDPDEPMCGSGLLNTCDDELSGTYILQGPSSVPYTRWSIPFVHVCRGIGINYYADLAVSVLCIGDKVTFHLFVITPVSLHLGHIGQRQYTLPKSVSEMSSGTFEVRAPWSGGDIWCWLAEEATYDFG